PKSGRLLRLPTPPQRVTAVAHTSEGKKLAVGCDDGLIHLWDLAGDALSPTVLRGHTLGVRQLAFSSDGSRLASTGADATIRLWSVTTAKETAVVRAIASTMVVFSADSKTLATAGDDGQSRVWDA